jgi:signal transduction histidine kinase
MPQQPPSLAEMVVTLVHTREAELARVSRFLHDEIGQVLSAVGLQLGVLRLDFQERVPEISERTAEIQKILEEAITNVRNLSYELNPAIVERAGLPFALNALAGRFRSEFPGTLRLLYDPAVQLPTAAGTALYKIAEQAVENAVAHARSTLIEVLVRPARAGPALVVKDNGAGFDIAAIRGRAAGLGLILMEYYSAQAGLQFSISSAAGKGTIVRATCPTGAIHAASREQKAGPA